VLEDGYIKVRLVANMDDAQMAGIIAESPGDDDDNDGAHVACLQCKDGQDENEAANHAVDQREHCHSCRQRLSITHLDNLNNSTSKPAHINNNSW
jgi:uncharacterized paraquat-inducible protein A